MARIRKKDKPEDNKNDQNNVQKSIRRKRVKKALSKATNNLKRKAKSECSPRKRRRQRKTKHAYNLRSSNSVILVSEVPCCESVEDRKKFARLGLNSALFCSSSRPAKRKQSHISVITISSSDDDVMSMDRTAEWVATMDLDNDGHLGEEEPSVEGMNITTNSTPENKLVKGSEAEDIRQQMSLLQLPTSPNSTFQPLCVSTPDAMPSWRLAGTMEIGSLPQTIESSNHTSHNSFLTNPSSNFNVNMTNLKSPHTVATCDAPSQQNMNDSSFRVAPRFYFGPPQPSREVWMNSESYSQQNQRNSSMSPIMTDFMFSGINHMPSGFSGSSSSNDDHGQRTETSRQRKLFQIPSTSESPVFSPIYEFKSDDSSKPDPK